MRVILWLSLALPLLAQSDDHPQLRELLKIRRLYVEKLSGGETAVQIRDMLIGALQNSRLFVLTENPEKADTVLRGSAEDLVYNENFTSNEGAHARSTIGSTRMSGVVRGGLGLGVGEQDSVHYNERKHEAMAAVRLVNKDGEVIWSTTQESTGGKFRGAASDVASKVTRQLVEDFARAKKISAPPGS